MAEDRILDKIRKLLALAERAGPGEAEAAMSAVRGLMARHKITDRELDAEPDSEWVETEQWERGRTPFEMSLVSSILFDYFFVRGIERSREVQPGRWRRRTVLFGRRADVEVAVYVGVYLLRTFRSLWAEHRRASRCRVTDARAYYLGLAKGLRKKLKTEDEKVDTEQLCGLVRAQYQINTEFERRYRNLARGRSISVPTTGAEAFSRGLQDGSAITIRPGLKPESPTLALPAPTH